MSKTVLIVDDEVLIVDISKRKLQEHGFEVMTALNGEEALAQLKIKIPDLIVLDVQMPDMNGYTFILEKNKVPAYVSIPVIMVTALIKTEEVFKHHGVLAYLIKPLKLQELVDKVVEVLK